MTNAQRQAKWREKNRALFNLRRRNARKNLPVPVLAEPPEAESRTPRGRRQDEGGEARESTIPINPSGVEQSRHNKVESDSRGGQNLPSIEQLRELVEKERLKVPVGGPVKPVIYRSDTGMVITRAQWEKREEEKRRAKEKGFTIDEYSQ